MSEKLYVLGLGETYREGIYMTPEMNILIFRNEDDAIRYREQLSAIDMDTKLIEMDKVELLSLCDISEYSYVIVEPNELVFPRIETFFVDEYEND